MEVYQACRQSGHELLLEVILPAGMPHSDALYLRAIQRFYNLGVRPDWWKLPPLSSEGWAQLTPLLAQRDPYCRGVVILGLDAPLETLQQGFSAAVGFPIVKGFAVGRTLFAQPAQKWLRNEIDDAELIEQVKDNYLQLIAVWRQRG